MSDFESPEQSGSSLLDTKISRRNLFKVAGAAGIATTGVTGAGFGIRELAQRELDRMRPLDKYVFFPYLRDAEKAVHERREYTLSMDSREAARFVSDNTEFVVRKKFERLDILGVIVRDTSVMAIEEDSAHLEGETRISCAASDGVKRLIERAGIDTINDFTKDKLEAVYTKTLDFINHEYDFGYGNFPSVQTQVSNLSRSSDAIDRLIIDQAKMQGIVDTDETIEGVIAGVSINHDWFVNTIKDPHKSDPDLLQMTSFIRDGKLHLTYTSENAMRAKNNLPLYS